MSTPCTPRALTLLPAQLFQALKLVALDPSQEITITAQAEGIQFDSLKQRYYGYLRGIELAAARQSLQDTDPIRQQLVNELAKLIPQLKISADPFRDSITIKNVAAPRKLRTSRKLQAPLVVKPVTFKQTTAPEALPLVVHTTSLHAILQHWRSLPDLTRGLEQVYELQATPAELQAFYLELRAHSEELVAFYVDGQLTVTTKTQMHARGQGDMIESFVQDMLQQPAALELAMPNLATPEPDVPTPTSEDAFALLRQAYTHTD